jgi:hypothetical protein
MTKEEQFIKLAKEYETQKDLTDTIREELEQSMLALGYDKYAQDPETSAVYKTIKPEGTFVAYRTIAFKRTALDGERGGTVLSKKEAEEQGFDLKRG